MSVILDLVPSVDSAQNRRDGHQKNLFQQMFPRSFHPWADASLASVTKEVNDLKQDNSELSFALALKTSQLAEAESGLAEVRGNLGEVLQTLAEVTQQVSEKQEELGQCVGSLRALSHPYGKDQGKLTVYKNCNCSDLKMWVDNQYIGEARSSFSETPPCGAAGTASVIVAAGGHRVTATDGGAGLWKFDATVREDSCTIHGLTSR
jgi:hypothetical protein